MIKVENVEVWGFKHAIRGMRNPLNSWNSSDSRRCLDLDCKDCRFYNKAEEDCIISEDEWELCNYVIGTNDVKLMQRLTKAGTEHRKFARQIFVSMDITSNHFWWQEFDTYKIGVTRNSCSKMHKIHVKSFEIDDFSHEGIDEVGGMTKITFLATLDTLEWLRLRFNETQEKKYWRAMLELLPMGYNIRATVTMSYENAMNMIHQRSHHKLDEWIEFTMILKDLPYMKEIIND